MHRPDRPERIGRNELGSLRDRLDALPANHPSSPGFAVDAAPVGGFERKEAVEEHDRPERASCDQDRPGTGSVDQRARAFLPAELAIAEALADRGAVVVALAEDSSARRRQPDALVDGRVTEFKSLSRDATDATVKNQLRTAKGQAPNVVIDARGSGLAEDSAALGLRRFLGSPWAEGRYASILVLGDEYMIETASLGNRAMNEHDVFVSGEAPADVVRGVIEMALGAAFRPSQDPEPVPALIAGATKVFFHDDHPFEDDTGFAVSRYRYWVIVRDSGRDEERQLAVARKVFESVKAAGWPALLSYGLQGNLAIYP